MWNKHTITVHLLARVNKASLRIYQEIVTVQQCLVNISARRFRCSENVTGENKLHKRRLIFPLSQRSTTAGLHSRKFRHTSVSA